MEAYAAQPDHSPTQIGYHQNRRANKSVPVVDKPGKIRVAPGRGQAAISHIRIAYVETTPMTATEYADAVEALAVLIARYEREHPEESTAA
jgi:hypothetical protein